MTDDDWAAMMRDNNEEVAPQPAPTPMPAAEGPPPGFENAKAASQADSQVLAGSRARAGSGWRVEAPCVQRLFVH